MSQEYDTFVESLGDLPDGGEVRLTVRDLAPGRRKYDARYVRAIVASSPEKLPDADVLRVRFLRGYLHPRPWAIKILEELGDFPPPLQGRTPSL
jgi:hypothetical protein